MASIFSRWKSSPNALPAAASMALSHTKPTAAQRGAPLLDDDRFGCLQDVSVALIAEVVRYNPRFGSVLEGLELHGASNTFRATAVESGCRRPTADSGEPVILLMSANRHWPVHDISQVDREAGEPGRVFLLNGFVRDTIAGPSHGRVYIARAYLPVAVVLPVARLATRERVAKGCASRDNTSNIRSGDVIVADHFGAVFVSQESLNVVDAKCRDLRDQGAERRLVHEFRYRTWLERCANG